MLHETTNEKTTVERKVKPVGLLRKYEQQEKYDARDTVQGSSNSYTEEDGPRDSSSRKGKPRNRTRAVNVRRACANHCAATVGFLIFLAVCIALLVIIFCSDSTDDTNEGGNRRVIIASYIPVQSSESTSGDVQEIANRSSNGNSSGVTSYITTASTDITITRSIRIYLIIFLVIFTGMVFGVFCCCVANTSSKCWSRLRSNHMLPMYAAFTRLPTVTVTSPTEWFEPSNPYMITHFDDDRAILSYDYGDEEYLRGVNISSAEVRRLPKRYVFVNYHAWQYAGSDTLWAGIVTKLSDAIEKEFGAICVRIFRMLEVERPSKSGPIKIGFMDSEDPRCLYVRFKFPQDRQWTLASRQKMVLFIVKEFGVVTECFKYCDTLWWYVRYATDKEAEYAEAALKLDNFDVSRKRPNLQTGQKISPNESSSSFQQTCSETQPALVNEITSDGQFPLSTLHSRTDDQLRTSLVRQQHLEMRDTTSRTYGSTDCCRFLTHFRRHPKTVCCGCPFLYCCLFFITAALLFPITLLILVDQLELKIAQSTRIIPVEVQILSWMPATLGVFVVAFRFCWAMCHSQTDRIRKSLAGSRGSMKSALGFMNEVKQEVMIMSQLINCIRFTHGVDYKIVLTIDDLDRCPYHKVKSVLEAVNILLSDRSSPFLCLIAVDSRVAVKCIEQDMGEVLLQANLTGHEYLKKIINLPFCLPEVSNNAKRKYFGGVMDSADATKLVARQPERKTNLMEASFDGGDNSVPNVREDCAKDGAHRRLASIDSGTTTDGCRTSYASAPQTGGVRGPQNVIPYKDYSEFRFRCREILNGDGEVGEFVHEYLCGNPRNMKRIFNVLSLTTHLMECIDERRERVAFMSWQREGTHRRSHTNSARRPSILNSDVTPKKQRMDFGRHPRDAEDLVKWIVAADQWPYRISYILQVVEDLDNRWEAGVSENIIEESCTLFEIYEKYVEPEIESNPGDISMLTLDCDPAALRSFLRRSKSLTRGRISSMFHITVNLDQSLRNGISRQRALPKVST